MEHDEKTSVEKTFAALKDKLYISRDNRYEFEGHFATSRSEYRLDVEAEVFGAYISEEGFIEVHARILRAGGLPRKQDDELIDKIHDTIIDMVYEGDGNMNPEHMVLVPHIEAGAIIFQEDDGLKKIEKQILNIFEESELPLEDVAELLERILGRVAATMAIKIQNDESILEGIVGNSITRMAARNQKEEIQYIR
jgi:hypothetical protein